MSWGKHLILDCAKCCPILIREPFVIHCFSNTLVNRINMVKYGEPQIHHFGSGNKAGYTLVQLIETSNIIAHFVEDNNSMHLDVFSCKEFDSKVVVATVKEFFKSERIHERLLERQT